MWEGDDETFGEGSPDQAQDIAYGGSGDVSPAPGSEEFFTQMILGTGKFDPRNLPPTPIGEDGARQVALPSYSQFPGPVESPAEPSPGYFRINPNATAWDWITGAGEKALGGLGSILSGGFLSPDPEFTGRDVMQYVDSSGRVHSDISQYSSGVPGSQPPGLQVDLGYGPLTGGTISYEQDKGLGAHSPLGPEGTIGKAASDFYGTNVAPHIPDIPGLAAGGLASLPQISQSGLYRAMGRG
jgi:hypothetical protein